MRHLGTYWDIQLQKNCKKTTTMASVKLTLDTRKARKDGKFPLKISVTHKGSALVSTGIYLLPDQFISGEVVNCKGYKAINNMAQSFLFNAQKTLFDFKLSGRLSHIKVSDLKNAISNSIGQYQEEEEKPYLFKDHLQKFIENKTNPRTKEIYQYTLNKIADFSDINNLTFEHINFGWLKSFEVFMSGSCGVNARAIHMRNIRAVFNDAIDYDLISPNIYPFRKFKIKKEKTAKRALTVDQLALLATYPCEEHLEKYRDLFMLIFYLVGINTVDILHLKEENIINGRIEYRRAKTGTLYSIAILPEAIELINKYRGKKYLLSFMDGYDNYKDFTKRMNDNLQRIGDVRLLKHGKKEITPLFPTLTTYWARHTWATIAAYLDIPEKTIAESLGHVDNSTTGIYIDFDRRKIDEANRRVVDFFKAHLSK